MVAIEGKLDGRPVTAEVHGPHDVRGDTYLIAVAIRLINAKHQLEGHPLLGGGLAGFEDERKALATLGEVLDPGWTFTGATYPLPDGAE